MLWSKWVVLFLCKLLHNRTTFCNQALPPAGLTNSLYCYQVQRLCPISIYNLLSSPSDIMSQLSLLTCEGSGKRELLDWVGAWKPVSLEGWRNSVSELCVYLVGQREKQMQSATTCTPLCGFNQLVKTEDTHGVIKCFSYLSIVFLHLR